MSMPHFVDRLRRATAVFWIDWREDARQYFKDDLLEKFYLIL